MRCESCGYENGAGSFCAECGSRLGLGSASEKRVSTGSLVHESKDIGSSQGGVVHSGTAYPGGQAAPAGAAHTLQSLGQHERVQQAAEVSRQYFAFFVKALVRPYQTMRNTQAVHAVHSYITMSLIALLTALFSILVLNRVSYGFGVSFMTGFIKPLLFTGITLLIGLAIVYGMTRLYRTTASWKQITAGYGTLLIPSVAALLLANLLFIIHLTTLSLFFMGIAFLIAFVAVNMSIFTYPVLQASHRTIDVTYALVIANVVLFYLIYQIVSNVLLSAIGGMFGSIF